VLRYADTSALVRCYFPDEPDHDPVVLVTRDHRQAAAAAALGMTVEQPRS
jgi:hypothetical protein